MWFWSCYCDIKSDVAVMVVRALLLLLKLCYKDVTICV